MTDTAVESHGAMLKSMCNLLGGACLIVGFVWIAQVFGFGIDDAATAAANTVWIVMGALFAGTGAGLLLVAHTDIVALPA